MCKIEIFRSSDVRLKIRGKERCVIGIRCDIKAAVEMIKR